MSTCEIHRFRRGDVKGRPMLDAIEGFSHPDTGQERCQGRLNAFVRNRSIQRGSGAALFIIRSSNVGCIPPTQGSPSLRTNSGGKGPGCRKTTAACSERQFSSLQGTMGPRFGSKSKATMLESSVLRGKLVKKTHERLETIDSCVKEK